MCIDQAVGLLSDSWQAEGTVQDLRLQLKVLQVCSLNRLSCHLHVKEQSSKVCYRQQSRAASSDWRSRYDA